MSGTDEDRPAPQQWFAGRARPMSLTLFRRRAFEDIHIGVNPAQITLC
ncbi:MAG: hypothetical protein ACLP8A_10090 [Methylovirgula sp.]